MQSMTIWQQCNRSCLDSTLLYLYSIMLQFLKEDVVQSSLWLSISIQVGRDVSEWPPLLGSKLYLLEIWFTYQNYSGSCSQTGFLFWVTFWNEVSLERILRWGESRIEQAFGLFLFVLDLIVWVGKVLVSINLTWFRHSLENGHWRHRNSHFIELYLNSSFISENHETILVSDGHGLMKQCCVGWSVT